MDLDSWPLLIEYTRYLPFIKEYLQEADHANHQQLFQDIKTLPTKVQDLRPYLTKIKSLEPEWRKFIRSIRVYLKIKKNKNISELVESYTIDKTAQTIALCKKTFGPFNQIIEGMELPSSFITEIGLSCDQGLRAPKMLNQPCDVNTDQVFIMLGASGTGKTTTMMQILNNSNFTLDDLVTVKEYGVTKNNQSIGKEEDVSLLALRNEHNDLNEFLDAITEKRKKMKTILETPFNKNSSRAHLLLHFKTQHSYYFYDMAGNESTMVLFDLLRKRLQNSTMTLDYVLKGFDMSKVDVPTADLVQAIKQSVYINSSISQMIEYLGTSGLADRTRKLKQWMPRTTSSNKAMAPKHIVNSIHSAIYGTVKEPKQIPSNVTLIGHIEPLNKVCTISSSTLDSLQKLLFASK